MAILEAAACTRSAASPGALQQGIGSTDVVRILSGMLLRSPKAPKAALYLLYGRCTLGCCQSTETRTQYTVNHVYSSVQQQPIKL